MAKLSFQQIPQWAKPDTPHKNALFEVAALVGFEGKWVRLSAEDQRAILGFAVFGKQQIQVSEDGTVYVRYSTCFGTTYEVAQYSAEKIARAALSGLKVSPGMQGKGYMHSD